MTVYRVTARLREQPGGLHWSEFGLAIDLDEQDPRIEKSEQEAGDHGRDEREGSALMLERQKDAGGEQARGGGGAEHDAQLE